MLANRVALVSGGSRGIGFAAARLLAKAGAKVALLARNQSGIDTAVTTLNDAFPDSCIGVCCDVVDAAQRRRALEEVTHSLGEPTLLLNAAGIAKDALLARQSDDLLMQHFRINVEAASALTKLVLRYMIRHGEGKKK